LATGRAQVAAILSSSFSWNWGLQELAYGYVLAASTPDDSSRSGGKADGHNFQQRRLLLLPVLSLVVAAKLQ
jgi:hypothetical protein